jgi:hypothetical protein
LFCFPRRTSESPVPQSSNYLLFGNSISFFIQSIGLTNTHHACPPSSLHRRYRSVESLSQAVFNCTACTNKHRCRRRRQSLPLPTLHPRPALLPVALVTLLPLSDLAQHLEESRLPRRLQVPLKLGVRAPEYQHTDPASPTTLRIPTKGARKGGAGGQYKQPGRCGQLP